MSANVARLDIFTKIPSPSVKNEQIVDQKVEKIVEDKNLQEAHIDAQIALFEQDSLQRAILVLLKVNLLGEEQRYQQLQYKRKLPKVWFWNRRHQITQLQLNNLKLDMDVSEDESEACESDEDTCRLEHKEMQGFFKTPVQDQTILKILAKHRTVERIYASW